MERAVKASRVVLFRMRWDVRVVKEVDSKSITLSVRRFESCFQRISFSRRQPGRATLLALKVWRVGFESTLVSELEPESSALDQLGHRHARPFLTHGRDVASSGPSGRV